MLWIKRNLFLAIGGLIAVLLLGFGLYFSWNAKARNLTLEEEIKGATTKLDQYFNSAVFPGPTNIDLSKFEAERLKGTVNEMLKGFSPVPTEKVTGLAFRSFRDNMLAELHRMAEAARTGLPGKGYAFSFETQKTKVDFKEGTFPAIPQQMSEVKALCTILFDAHVDPLVNIRRSRVSKDDEESSATSDYHLLPVVTNAPTETIQSPYELTFNCLSSDLAAVLQGFLKSPHGFIVKAVHVEPAVEAPAPGQQGGAPNQPIRPGQPPPRPAPGRPLPPPTAPPAVGGKSLASDKSVILLKERRLKVTLLVYAIRPAN